MTTKTGRYYLSVVKDLGSKEIAAYNVSTKHDLGLVMNTINQLQKHKKEAIMHSDRGGLYTSFQYIQKLKELNLTRSMSRSGNCLDNAPIESFFGHLKDEMDYTDCKSLETSSQTSFRAPTRNRSSVADEGNTIPYLPLSRRERG